MDDFLKPKPDWANDANKWERFQKHVRQACFDLAMNIMFEHEGTPLEKMKEDAEETARMADGFFDEAFYRYHQHFKTDAHMEVLVSAIRYIDSVHAIPQLRGQQEEWFRSTLATLLEFAEPHAGVQRDSLPFLKRAHWGIWKYLEDLAERDEDEE